MKNFLIIPITGADPDDGKCGSSRSQNIPSELTFFQDIRCIILKMCMKLMFNLRSVFFGQNSTLIMLEMAFPGTGCQTFFGGAYPQTTLGFGWGKG